LTLFTILFPVVLMLVGSWADKIAAPGSPWNETLRLIGNDDIALLIGVLLSFYTLGRMRGFTRATILRFSNECLGPTASITLLVARAEGLAHPHGQRRVQPLSAWRCIAMCRSLLAWLLAALIGWRRDRRQWPCRRRRHCGAIALHATGFIQTARDCHWAGL